MVMKRYPAALPEVLLHETGAAPRPGLDTCAIDTPRGTSSISISANSRRCSGSSSRRHRLNRGMPGATTGPDETAFRSGSVPGPFRGRARGRDHRARCLETWAGRASSDDGIEGHARLVPIGAGRPRRKRGRRQGARPHLALLNRTDHGEIASPAAPCACSWNTTRRWGGRSRPVLGAAHKLRRSRSRSDGRGRIGDAHADFTIEKVPRGREAGDLWKALLAKRPLPLTGCFDKPMAARLKESRRALARDTLCRCRRKKTEEEEPSAVEQGDTSKIRRSTRPRRPNPDLAGKMLGRPEFVGPHKQP